MSRWSVRERPTRAVRERRAIAVVAGLGNEFRRDDGIGPLVAARVADQACAVLDIGPLAEPLDLLGRWDGADLVVLVDAVRSGAAPGTIGLVDLEAQLRNELDRDGSSTASTHGISLAGCSDWPGRSVPPGRVVVVGIEGVDFAHGTGLSRRSRELCPMRSTM